MIPGFIKHDDLKADGQLYAVFHQGAKFGCLHGMIPGFIKHDDLL